MLSIYYTLRQHLFDKSVTLNTGRTVSFTLSEVTDPENLTFSFVTFESPAVAASKSEFAFESSNAKYSRGHRSWGEEKHILRLLVKERRQEGHT